MWYEMAICLVKSYMEGRGPLTTRVNYFPMKYRANLLEPSQRQQKQFGWCIFKMKLNGCFLIWLLMLIMRTPKSVLSFLHNTTLVFHLVFLCCFNQLLFYWFHFCFLFINCGLLCYEFLCLAECHQKSTFVLFFFLTYNAWWCCIGSKVPIWRSRLRF